MRKYGAGEEIIRDDEDAEKAPEWTDEDAEALKEEVESDAPGSEQEG